LLPRLLVAVGLLVASNRSNKAFYESFRLRHIAFSIMILPLDHLLIGQKKPKWNNFTRTF